VLDRSYENMLFSKSMNKTELLAFLRRPFQDRDGFKKIGIGGLIGCVPILNCSLLGYLLNWIISIYKEPKDPEDVSLPEWKNLGKLLASGLIVFVIILSYSLPPFILLGFGNVVVFLGGTSVILGQLFKFLADIGFGLVSFILPVALIQFARSKKLEDAYNIKTIGERIAGVFSEYLLVYLFSLGLVIITWIIIVILSPLILGYILAPILNFYIALVIFYRFSSLLSKTGR